MATRQSQVFLADDQASLLEVYKASFVCLTKPSQGDLTPYPLPVTCATVPDSGIDQAHVPINQIATGVAKIGWHACRYPSLTPSPPLPPPPFSLALSNQVASSSKYDRNIVEKVINAVKKVLLPVPV